MKEWKQLILGSTLFAIGSLILLELVSCIRNNGDDVIWLIPEGYRGHIVLVEGWQKGEEKKYEDGSRLYHFPKSGVLKTKFGVNRGWHKERCYLVDEEGNRKELKIRYSNMDLEDIPLGEPYLSAGNISFWTSVPYPRFFSRVVLERGSEEEFGKHEHSKLESFILDYAKRSNDI